MGCGRTLFLDDEGFIACLSAGCPRPDAAAAILADCEIAHVVVLDEDAFTIRHPLRERLDDALMECVLHEYIASLAGPPESPGRYRVLPDGISWAWARQS